MLGVVLGGLPRHVVAVASGKGGVGKSTVAVNVALALATACKMRVGLADVDVFGPSLPTMMNVKSVEPPAMDAETKLLDPVINYGVATSSLGFLMDEAAQPAVWRGPMVMSMVKQLVWGVEWGPTEILVIDTPPGTGDALLTLTQEVPLSGAVIVSTPQEVAVVDAIKGANMFRKLRVPLLGLVENMAYYTCPSCGERDDVFGAGGLDKLNAAVDGDPVPLLGQLPLSSGVRAAADAGTPIVVADPQSEAAQAYVRIASQLLDALEAGLQPRR
ncbi:ATPase [Thecamonas trahens ATCC 50062]|uniref:ATPase n=1 Tax=Thecamonas trahens ATCC 50062 TaxID=461836 RepID=A0A0L0D0M8_THETB|nr:ATPase [Thecamonas trahens ATCC 50062]KNC45929.1 ATPase [Thecamonas trahens ATCC 50062]|eukprot:XP_013762912.1 ATPase [Thecamonas trahens ATCC 50062]